MRFNTNKGGYKPVRSVNEKSGEETKWQDAVVNTSSTSDVRKTGPEQTYQEAFKAPPALSAIEIIDPIMHDPDLKIPPSLRDQVKELAQVWIDYCDPKTDSETEPKIDPEIRAQRSRSHLGSEATNSVYLEFHRQHGAVARQVQDRIKEAIFNSVPAQTR